MDRIVALVDMDCFFVQVEQRLNPDLKAKPCAVAQYTERGVIIAVSYEARAFGVTRGMSRRDAKAKCPNILLPKIPKLRGKADLTKYREAGAEVIKVFSQFCQFVERASIDEAYFDLTKEIEEKMKTLDSENLLSFADQMQNTYVIGWEDNQTEKPTPDTRAKCVRNWLEAVQSSQSEPEIKLAIGSCLVEQMRAAVYEQTGFTCSAGISCNKMLAKLAAGIHKPNQQTILPHASVESFFVNVPLRKIRNLGGKFGNELCEHHGIKNMSDLWQFTKEQLCDMYGRKTGLWLYDLCRGYDSEPVSARKLPKSIGCSKNFPGKDALDTREKVKYWLSQLATEVEERLLKDKEDNKRIATSMIVGFRYQDPVSQNSIVSSRTTVLTQYNRHKLAADAFILLQQFNLSPSHQASWTPHINMLSMSAGKFVEIGITQFGGISALLQKQINNSKFTIQTQNNPEVINPTNPKTNDKKPKAKTIQSFFSQMLVSDTARKSEGEVSQHTTQDAFQNMTTENLSSVLHGKNNTTDRTIEGFFARKQILMNCTKKEFSPLKDFHREAKTVSNGQTQEENSNLIISRFFSTNSMEAETENLVSLENSIIPFSESLSTSENLSIDSSLKSLSSQSQKGLEYCVISSSDNETTDDDSVTAEDNFKTGIFKNLYQEAQNCGPSVTALIDNEYEIKLGDNECSNVKGKNIKTLVNGNDSDAKPNKITANKTMEENSNIFYLEEKDLNLPCDSKNKLAILDSSKPVSVSILSPSVFVDDNNLTDSNKKQVDGKESELSHQLSDIATNSSSVCFSENQQTPIEALDFVTCGDCLKKVLVWDFEEHKDFHFAEKLQKRINSDHGSSIVHSQVSLPVKKRKSQTVQPTCAKKKKSKNNVQTLEFFFKK